MPVCIMIGSPPPTVDWTDSAADASATSPETFSGMSIGAAGSSRQVFVAVYNGVASAVTVGGVAATSVVSVTGLSLWRAAVPTGTSASVVVTFTGGGGRLLISVWAAYNLRSTTPFDTATYSASSTPATTHTTTINTDGGGILIGAAATVVTTGDGGPSWTGATLRNSRILDIGALGLVLSAADAQATAAATGATLRTTWSPAVGNVDMVGATFR